MKRTKKPFHGSASTGLSTPVANLRTTSAAIIRSLLFEDPVANKKNQAAGASAWEGSWRDIAARPAASLKKILIFP
jgi:hypothetical protein